MSTSSINYKGNNANDENVKKKTADPKWSHLC